MLQLKEVEKPIPNDRELLVKVHAATVTRGDIHLRKLPGIILVPMGWLFGFKRKKIPGHEFSGRVEAVGKNVRLFRTGDEVFGTTTGLSYGANAEYVCIPEQWKQGVVAIKPAKVSHEIAAAVPIGGMTALQILRKAHITSGQKVLIYGASGSVGSYAVQLAKHFGAEVTGVCSSTNLEMVRAFGADKVMDYTREDFTKTGLRYDVIFDAVGKIKSWQCKGSLNKSGSYLSTWSLTKEMTEDLNFLKTLLEMGKLKAIIDRRYPLEQIGEAHRYVEKGHKKGNVVISVN
jgi:NADPH:quinone reductase-like Zn-dependent oxidoreductase